MLLTVKDLQSRFQIGRDAAYSLVHSPGFPVLKIGKRYFIPEKKLGEWVEQHTYKQFLI